MKRREFLNKLATLSAGLVLADVPILSGQEDQNNTEIFDRIRHDKNWPYPEDMDSAERVWFEKDAEAWVNIFAKPGKNLDIRLFTADTRGGLYRKPPINLSGIEDSHDICIGPVDIPALHYVIEYKEGKGPWKSLAPHEVKTPNIDIENGGTIKIVLIGDDHIYADLQYEPEDEEWRKEWLRGDYVSSMIKGIIDNPDYYRPEFNSWQMPLQGFTYAWASKYILETRPDLIIDLGDTAGPDSFRIWGARGQWPDELQPEGNWKDQARILWERKRRIIASISPEIPFYFVSGNHDGDNGWEPFKSYTTEQRERLLRLPKLKPIHFIPEYPASLRTSVSALSGDRKFLIFPEFNGNHYVINWANGDVQFMVLDLSTFVEEKPKKITDWTLGKMQKKTLEFILKRNFESPWKFICSHHTVGGYPLGPGTNRGAYGRGPLFTREDYERAKKMAVTIDQNAVFDPDKVEQLWLTELAIDYNVRGFFYGHDHVFFYKLLEELTSQGKEMIGACVGSTKFMGGDVRNLQWCNPYWVEFYGSYFEDPSPFHTPPGITELKINKYGATIKYICCAPPGCMYHNMPPGTRPGSVLRTHRISR
jgi:hypothetical protein